MTDERRKALLDAFNVLVQAYVPKDVPQAQECVENIRQALTEPPVPDVVQMELQNVRDSIAFWGENAWSNSAAAKANAWIASLDYALAQGTKHNDH